MVHYAVPFDYLGYDLNVKRGPPYNRPMRIPKRIPGLKLLTLLLAFYAAIWIALEGNLGRLLVLAVGVVAAALAYGVQRLHGGRTLSGLGWLLFAGLAGLLLGSGTALLSLLLMAVKTGLHAHGAEFSPEQINWIVGQLPWWAGAGLLAGVGAGLLVLALRQSAAE